ncbi:phosphoserine transaminase [Chromatium okenii]|jgi:phosphoserine aminotransferase|uniref:Phosphoserine aminotransferase n=1 Tax=Chromatium okenii TaxID=61644 RepID=A0A2S7XTI0_9GAMM|nr:phosphoserine transaminase [Chromatium okenii]MBV5311430.1 phosphoserine transaminase [Chromatium okenii]PQJ97037.1 3-phosphoserine/phosphohydroxythreonine transaminase [Chromatium okenii]
MNRNALNFSGGPGVLPATVLAQTQQAIAEVPEVGLSVLGISHRSDWFAEVVAETERNIAQLLHLPANYAVLLLQGGATLQFSMIPMLLLRQRQCVADYVRSGYWSSKSIPPAQLEGAVRILWDGELNGFRNLPKAAELSYSKDAAYLHYVSNETVEGIQFHELIGDDAVARVCDMSSDMLSRPFDASRFALIYAHAQKNLGPAGVTLVIIRRELLEQAPNNLPEMLDYRAHLAAHSIYNTPPVLAIYVTLLVTRWLLHDIGGLAQMDALNRIKAAMLYAVIDEHAEMYCGHAAREHRSLMNVVFTLPTFELERDFLQQAAEYGFSGLKGHRSLGGIRASIYNAMTNEAVAALCQFMVDFARRI